MGTTTRSTLEGKHEKLDAIVVGAGFAGLYMLHRLAKLGMAARAYEAGSGVGGTWFWNRYPGARCDVESLEYSYSFSEALQQEWRWSHAYAEQPEILRYLEHVADRFGLRPLIQFNTRIRALTYDEERGRWAVDADDGTRVWARHCVMATGNLSTPRMPDFKGLERFEGSWHHSGLWPEAGVDFSGQRVALIGTGATGIQMAPKIAAQAQHLYVFQRTANYSVPARNAAMQPDAEHSHKADYAERRRRARGTAFGISGVPLPPGPALSLPPVERDRHYERTWHKGGSAYFLSAYSDLLTSLDANETAAEFVRRKIRGIVRDPATAALLEPKDHPIGTKRLCVDTDYYETFNRDNVTLVDARRAPIQEVTATGLRTTDAEYEVDAIALATGFDAMTGALREIDIAGRGGVRLDAAWALGPSTYLGLMVAGFPNLFIVTGPGSPSVKSNMVCSIEQHVEWIADCLEYLRSHGFDTIEAEAQAERDWGSHVAEVADATLYPRAESWYSGSNIPGKPRVFMPYVGGVGTYRGICDAVAAEGYRGFTLGRSMTRTAAPSGMLVPAGGPERWTGLGEHAQDG